MEKLFITVKYSDGTEDHLLSIERTFEQAKDYYLKDHNDCFGNYIKTGIEIEQISEDEFCRRISQQSRESQKYFLRNK